MNYVIIVQMSDAKCNSMRDFELLLWRELIGRHMSVEGAKFAQLHDKIERSSMDANS
jgi:hypothetical protein